MSTSLPKFPSGFSFGVSTSSYQIEGAVSEGGRGKSIWDVFSHTAGRVMHGDTGDIACDHYHRLDEDLDLLKELGVDVYRFSIAWPRIQPNGTGPANPEGVAFYNRLIDGLQRRRISPVPTLYHWDLPQALQDRGGWANRQIADWFTAYAKLAVEAFGDRVTRWTTLNEPWVAAYLGYRIGLHAPGIADEAQTAAAHHHMLLAHAGAVRAIRAATPAAEVGIALNLMHIYPASGHPDDVAAADLADTQLNKSFLQPLFAGSYPTTLSNLSERWALNAGLVRPGDLEDIAQPLDFLSINSYHPRFVCAPSRVETVRTMGFAGGYSSPFAFGLPFVDVEPATATKTDIGWIIEPKGLEDLLLRLGQELPKLPLYISENGAAFADYADPSGAVVDEERVGYFESHLEAAHAAMKRGVDLRGYWAWSFMDNFEWAFGYSKRFGLVYVDYPTAKRTPKSSFRWFQGLIRARVTAGNTV